MEKITLLFIFLVVVFTSATAQKTVALHSNGAITVFGGNSPLTEAYTASVTGDTLYVSGGIFAAPDTINKGLVIIGAGYDTDSTAVTGKTFITSSTINSGRIVLGSNASNLYMEGMQFQGGLVKTDPDITGFTLIRLKIAELVFSNAGIIPTNASIIQCYIGNLTIEGVTNSVISNCILRGAIIYSNTNIFKNNVITYGSGFGILRTCNANTFMNNIFSTTNNVVSDGNCSYNNFQYNIFAHLTPILQTAATDLNNYKEIDMATVFVNEVASDFHLLPNASTTYLSDDGTQVGLYGGFLPFKDGAVPSNPHISYKAISTATGNNGALNISFKVNAQKN